MTEILSSHYASMKQYVEGNFAPFLNTIELFDLMLSKIKMDSNINVPTCDCSFILSRFL